MVGDEASRLLKLPHPSQSYQARLGVPTIDCTTLKNRFTSPGAAAISQLGLVVNLKHWHLSLCSGLLVQLTARQAVLFVRYLH